MQRFWGDPFSVSVEMGSPKGLKGTSVGLCWKPLGLLGRSKLFGPCLGAECLRSHSDSALLRDHCLGVPSVCVFRTG